MQYRGSSSGQGCAVCCQVGHQAKGQRQLGDLGFSREQDFLDQPQAGVPAVSITRKPRIIPLSRRRTGVLYSSQLALDGLQVEVLVVDAVDLAVRNMEHKAAQELIVPREYAACLRRRKEF